MNQSQFITHLRVITQRSRQVHVYLHKKVFAVTRQVQPCDLIEQLKGTRDIGNAGCGEEATHVVAVTEEELMRVRVHLVDSLTNVDEVQRLVVPQHVVRTKVGMNQITFTIHLTHSL